MLPGGTAGAGQQAHHATPEASFSTGLDYSHALDETDRYSEGIVRVSDFVRTPSKRWMRASALLTISDMVVGSNILYNTHPDVPLTVDMQVHQLVDHDEDELVMESHIRKIGRKISYGETFFRLPGSGRLAAVVSSTFAVTPNPNAYAGEMHRSGGSPGLMDRDLVDYVEVRRPAPGVAEVDRAPGRGNSTGSLQGGLVTLVAEVAAETLTGGEAVDIDIKFLRSVQVGPGRATAARVGPDVVRVEVSDPGDADRLCAIAVVRQEHP
jgi:acyl-coenzyme A thioesterase PaaI-like protein